MADNAPALNALAEAMARIEYKLDLLLWSLNVTGVTTQLAPNLGNGASKCPLCFQVIQYQVDIVNKITLRVCGCKTGMLPPTVSFAPEAPEVSHVRAPDAAGGSEPEPAGAPHRRGRKER